MPQVQRHAPRRDAPQRRNSNRALRYPHTGRACALPLQSGLQLRGIFFAAKNVASKKSALRCVSGSPALIQWSAPVGWLGVAVPRFARRSLPLRSRRCARSRPRGRWLRRVLALAAQARCILAADQPRRACGLRPPSHLGAEPAAPRSGASAGEKPNPRGQRKTKPRRRRAGGGGGSESPVREKWGPSLASQVRETFATTKHTLS